MKLRPIQAWALSEFVEERGGVGMLGPGSGKTLVSLVLPVLTQWERPVLFVPASLRDKTVKIDHPLLSRHWRLPALTSGPAASDAPGSLEVRSYEELSQESFADYLELRKIPDGVIFDECFPASTRVSTEHGEIGIGEIVDSKIQVRVLSKNLATGKTTFKPIARWLRINRRNKLVRITHDNGVLVCTENHEIWTEEQGFVAAGSLTTEHTVEVQRGTEENSNGRETVSDLWETNGTGLAPVRIVGVSKAVPSETVLQSAMSSTESNRKEERGSQSKKNSENSVPDMFRNFFNNKTTSETLLYSLWSEFQKGFDTTKENIPDQTLCRMCGTDDGLSMEEGESILQSKLFNYMEHASTRISSVSVHRGKKAKIECSPQTRLSNEPSSAGEICETDAREQSNARSGRACENCRFVERSHFSSSWRQRAVDETTDRLGCCDRVSSRVLHTHNACEGEFGIKKWTGTCWRY
jgi:hypothetical protein